MKPNDIQFVETQNFASPRNASPRNGRGQTTDTQDIASLPQPQQQGPGMDIPKYKDKYRTETTRLKSWNYGANGYYFVTIYSQEP